MDGFLLLRAVYDTYGLLQIVYDLGKGIKAAKLNTLFQLLFVG